MNDVISSMKLIRESRYIPAEAKREFDAVMPLVERFGKLGPNARRVLLALAERLVVGIPHGDFDKPHDWDKESSEEALDLAVYQAAKLLGLGKAEEPDGIERSAWTRTPREELYTFGHEFIHGKKYTRFHEGNPRVTLVDDDGRTPDGKPWVPPAGARVRVVFQPARGKGRSSLVIEGQTLTVTTAEYCRNPDFAEIGFVGHKNGEPRHCRVVPA